MWHQILIWGVFNVFVLLLLALDLGVFHRKEEEISIRQSLIWSVIWLAMALLFNVGVYYWRGRASALEFFTGYLLERSLSVDNLFVFLLVFSFFSVPQRYQYKVLFWGILGALIMRAVLILAGAALIHAFHWVIYVFGAFLILTGFKLAFQKDEGVHVEKNPVIKVFKRFFPVTSDYHGGKFFIFSEGRIMATPLFIVLLVVETTDLAFALDSIPAIFAVTTDSFIVYSSNVCAILGLRALYFALAGVMKYFHYLKVGLSIILVLIGIKMLLDEIYPVSITLSLAVIALILVLSVILSVIFPPKKTST